MAFRLQDSARPRKKQKAGRADSHGSDDGSDDDDEDDDTGRGGDGGGGAPPADEAALTEEEFALLPRQPGSEHEAPFTLFNPVGLPSNKVEYLYFEVGSSPRHAG